MRKVVAKLLVAGMILALGGVIPVHASAACAGDGPGGDWLGYGGDLQGTRTQPAEHTIALDNVDGLTAKWTFSVTAAGGQGNIPSSALEYGGCVYAWTTNGFVYALNADSGQLVWSRHIGGVDPAAPAINDGVIYFSQNTTGDREGIHAIALDAATGATVWVSETVATDGTTATGAVYGNGIVMVGTGQGEFSANNTGGFALIDAASGALLKRTHTVPDDQAARGFPGCSIWSHAAFDPETNYAYVGSGQPGNWDLTAANNTQSEYCDAIVKIDFDRSRPTFGTIVGSREGTRDVPPYIDVDFGGGGNTVMKLPSGEKLSIQIQKSGWVHAATESMHAAWSTLVSPVANTGSTVGNYTGVTTDGTNVFTVGAWPGQVFSLNAMTGAVNWVTPVVSPVATNPVAFANGVLYYSDEKGVLNAFDPATGIPVLMHPIKADNTDCTRNQSGGIAIARNKVYAVCGPVVAAYGL